MRHPLYLIVDEYDNFTNIVLNEQGEAVYHAITHADGFYRDTFKLFKGMFERIFLTGVSPVTLDDLTSGFNIGWHISTNPRFDKMLGFSTEDVRQMFAYYKAEGRLPADCDVEAMIDEMKPWYDNYCFAEECLNSDIRVFNCDLVLSFPARELTNPEIFPSLLFYYGMLTIVGTLGSRLVLGIPNNNVRKQYYEFLLESYQPMSGLNLSGLHDYFDAMAFEGEWQGTLRYIADAYKRCSSVRDAIEGERNIQGFFLAYLSLNDYYLTAPELELAHGFCDFFLLPDLTHYASKHSYIVEIKYLSKGDQAAKAETQWREAVEQINRYAVAPRVEVLRQGTQLHKIVMQFAGWELLRMEEIE